MKLKFKLSLLTIAIMVIVIGSFSGLSLWKARQISNKLALETMISAAQEQADHWKAQENRYTQKLRTLANIMADYENVPAELRRDRFDAALRGVIAAEPNIINLYTVWKPNAIDSMDAEYIDRIGSTKTGQYAITYSIETGGIRARTTIDVENSMAYFNGPNSKKDRVEEPFPRKLVSGRNVILVRIMVPVVNPRTNETVGGVGMLWDISDIQKEVENTVKGHEKITHLSVYSNDGFIMGNNQTDKVGKMLTEAGGYGSATEAVQHAVEKGEEFNEVQFMPEQNELMRIRTLPINVGNSDFHWSVMVGVPESFIMADAKDLQRFIVILALLFVTGSAAIIFLVLSAMTAPILKVTDAIKDISEGEGDLTQRIDVKSSDEIGKLVSYFNKLMNALQNPIGDTKRTVESLAAASEELSTVSRQLSSNSEQVAGQTATVASTTEQMARSINSMASAAEQASVNANEVAGAAEQMSVNMNTIASAIEEMSASISQIASNAGEARQVAGEATTKSSEATNAMNKLGTAAKEIGQVTNVIKAIADKTNLLALNATIEAASAGEAGKGFAVVAGEIKELANQSAQSADDIARRIDGIQTETGGAVKVIEDVSGIISKINLSIEAIASYVEQQTKASNEIASNVAQANTGAKRVAGAIGEVAKGSHDIARNAGEAAKGATTVNQNINGVSDAAKEFNHGASQVNVSASDLAKMAEHLREVMNLFRV